MEPRAKKCAQLPTEPGLMHLPERRAMGPTGGFMKALAMKLMEFYEQQGEKIIWSGGYPGLMV